MNFHLFPVWPSHSSEANLTFLFRSRVSRFTAQRISFRADQTSENKHFRRSLQTQEKEIILWPEVLSAQCRILKIEHFICSAWKSLVKNTFIFLPSFHAQLFSIWEMVTVHKNIALLPASKQCHLPCDVMLSWTPINCP
jgi:hypothetical protein